MRTIESKELKRTVLSAALDSGIDNRGLIGPEKTVEPEYQSILDYATSQGYTLPSETWRSKGNALVKYYKDNGIWDDLDVLWNFWTDGDSNFSLINWKNPGTYNFFIEVGAPVFTSLAGWNSASPSTNHLRTLWSPALGIKFTLNEAGHFAWINTDAAIVLGTDYGTRNAAGAAVSLGSRNTSDQLRVSINAGVVIRGSGFTTAIGLYHMLRTGSLQANSRIWKNGLDTGFDIHNSSSLADFGVRLFGLPNSLDTGINNTSNRQVSYLGFGASLIGKENLLYTGWQTYKT